MRASRRMGRVPFQTRIAVVKLHEEKALALLEENNRLKNWWFADMTYDPEMRGRNLDSSWEPCHAELRYAEHWRQGTELAARGFVELHADYEELRNLEMAKLKAELALKDEEMKGVRRELAKAQRNLKTTKGALRKANRALEDVKVDLALEKLLGSLH